MRSERKFGVAVAIFLLADLVFYGPMPKIHQKYAEKPRFANVCGSSGGNSLEGKDAPDFTLFDLSGQSHPFPEKFRGKRLLW